MSLINDLKIQIMTYLDYRLDLFNSERKSIKPKHKLGDSPLRFNWQTPILISPHNQDIIYFGSNKLHRSFNKGDDWEEISDDLTTGGKRGNVPYGTITSFDESIFQFGKLVVGSDDGILSISDDSGKSWKSINKNLPPDLWVSRVIFSKHENNRIYLSLNGYRYNDFKPYIFLSDDNGDNWENISSNLPDYFDVVKTPMDLGSIKKRMENNCYKSILDFAADVRLTFDNAVTYNGDGSDVCKVAREMKLTFEKLYQVMIATIEAEEKQRKLKPAAIDDFFSYWSD